MLEELDLFANNLTGPIPPELGNLTMLEFVSLIGNDLSGCIPAAFPDVWVINSSLARCEQ